MSYPARAEGLRQYDNQHEKRVEKTWRRKIRIDSLRITLKKYQIGKLLSMTYIDSSITDRLAIEMNRFLQEAEVPKWITKRKTVLIQKDSPKRPPPNNYAPTDDVENITNKGVNLRFDNMLKTFHQGRERMSQVEQKHWRATIHRSTHPQQEQDEMKKSELWSCKAG